MPKKNNRQRSALSLAIISILVADGVYANANFTITPAAPLPTSNFSTSSQVALFTVTNMTSSQRNGYVVAGLPSNVTQYTNSANSALCTNPINLGPHLGPNDHCLLQLNIVGPVHSQVAIRKGSSVTRAAEALNVDLATGSLPLVAAGVNNDNSIAQPLIAQSPDGGTTWSYPPLPALGSNAQGGFISVYSNGGGVSCSGLICVAVGEDITISPSLSFNPLIARSQDGGITWEYKTPTNNTPANQSVSGSFHSVSCTGLTCVAVGEDILFVDSSLPRIAESQDGGLTWAYQPISNNSFSGYLRSVSCSGTYCAAVGGINNNAIVAASIDGGITWAEQSITDVPLDSSFRSVSCNGPSCVAVGQYTANSVTYPYVVANTDIFSSPTWTRIPITDTPSGYLNGVSCVNSSCVAVGSTGSNPLSIHGTISSSSWAISTTDVSADGGQFNGVSCAQLPSSTEMSCVAAGSLSTTPTALIEASVNGGANFSAKTIDAIPIDGHFNSVSCALTNTPTQSINCLAAGQLSDNSPLVASSQGGVESWGYASSLTGVSEGYFGGTSASTASLLPNSLKALVDEHRR